MDECFLAHTTLFLLALASAKCVGELHALSFRVSHSEDWSEASFRFVPGFVAKTQYASSNDQQFEGFCVPALPKSSTNPNSRLLCPVRTVRCYLARTALHHLQCERLLVTSGHLNKIISKNTVSFWLRKVISQAYRLSGRPLPSPFPKARETRGIAPSLQEELCCPPVVEGGYLAASYNLYMPLLEGPVAQVPRHLPPGSCGGGSSPGMTRPLARTCLPLTHD